MKSFILLIFFTLITLPSLSANDFKFYVSPGLGFYDMSQLKDYNSFIRATLPFETKQMSNFPPFWNFTAGVHLFSEQMKYGYGINYSFESTGSRISRKDYSGEYSGNFTANSNSYGIDILFNQKEIWKFNSYIRVQVGIKNSDLNIKEYMLVGEVDTLTTLVAEASSFFFEPGIMLIYPISFFEVGIKIGYQLDFEGDYEIKSINGQETNSNYQIAQPNNPSEPINTQWSGFRCNFTASVNLTRLIKSFSH